MINISQVNKAKLDRLMMTWMEHERWIQEDDKRSQTHIIKFPGYGLLSGADLQAYDIYRHSMVPYFSKAEGFPNVHESLEELIHYAQAKDSKLFSALSNHYEDPSDKFLAQWGNVFGTVYYTGLTHEVLLEYQRRYEVDLPLCFLAHLRELVTRGSIEFSLDRFRDGNDSLKKGVIIQYIIDGLRSFPELQNATRLAYQPKLRNAIGHNAYTITKNRFRAFNNEYELSVEEFYNCFTALQVVQNTVLSYFLSRRTINSSLTTKGILAIGWGLAEKNKSNIPVLVVYQVEPFFRKDPTCEWLTFFAVAIEENTLRTNLANVYSTHGSCNNDLEEIIRMVELEGAVNCRVKPVMPCIHDHDTQMEIVEEFCPTGDEIVIRLPLAAQR